MKVPLSWLRELVDVEAELDELLEVMGRNGLEVEEVRTPGGGVEGVRVARVLEVADHPDAEKLVVVTVDDGEGERTVLAGARNMTAGDLVPLAVPGARLPRGVEIGRREMRGIVSDGMLCSARELEVADDHAGIMVLDGDAAPGTDIHEVLPLGEPVIDVAVPADRGDLHSVHGIARDLAAILDVEARLPELAAAERHDGKVPIRIEAADGCPRYVGWVVEDLSVGRSPWWLRRRLEVCGIRSLSNLVDVTNYVMLERGQPLHAFDLDTLRGPEIVVRWARAGEKLRTLDGRDRSLEATDLVIADAERAVALAGVMGGEETEVGPGTTRILLEAAAFDPAAVRRTSRRLGLVSEASTRFERRVDPSGSRSAAARAVDLLVELTGGSDGGVQESGDGAPPARPIRLDPRWSARFLGLEGLEPDAQAALLRRAGMKVEEESEALLVTPPTWRADIARPADVAEEVARLYGYEKIPAELPPLTLSGGLSARQRAEREVRSSVLASGFHEAQTWSFVGEDALVLLAPEDPGRVRLQNPLAKDTAIMRPSLAEGLLAAARRNAGQGRDGLALFEIGRVFREVGGPLDDVLAADAEGGTWLWHDPDGVRLPTQPVVLGLAAYGTKQGDRWLDRERPWTVYDALAAVDAVAARFGGGASALERVPVARPRLHPGRTAVLRWRGREIGVVGQLHPVEADARDLPEQTVVGEILLDPLWGPLARGELGLPEVSALARHPAIHVDVAVVVPEVVAYERVEAAVRRGAGDLLDRLHLFDEYRGAQVGEGRRSLAFHLRLQAPDRQLTDADADQAIDAVAEAVTDVGGTLRR